MTSFEHAMVGITGAVAANLHRRHGWPIVALAGFAAMLPDWDGLTILCGIHCYAAAHRVWGHNLLVAGLVGARGLRLGLAPRRTAENPPLARSALAGVGRGRTVGQ